jgi:molybdopterin-guanine dinucleotide biosynthesis protein B
MNIPVLSFVGRSNTGKTTLIERLIPVLKSKGLRVATIKHHLHDFEIDLEGKDSYRHKKAGARLAMIASPKKIALVEDVDGEPGLEEILSRYVRDVDLVITEGYKEERVPRIEIYDGRGDLSPLSQGHEGLLALISDTPLEAPVPVLRRDEIQKIAQLIVERLNL